MDYKQFIYEFFFNKSIPKSLINIILEYSDEIIFDSSNVSKNLEIQDKKKIVIRNVNFQDGYYRAYIKSFYNLKWRGVLNIHIK